jgi:threonine dehydratase
MHFSVVLEDKPGTLARLLALISQEGGNILHIHHMQGERDIPVQMARVSIELETRGWEHIEVFKKSFQDNGYEIRMG